MASVFSDFARSFVREARTTAATPLLWLTGIVMPIIWCVALAAVFATGLMRGIPVGLVDADNSFESRELVRALEAVPSVDFVNYENTRAATADLASGKIFGLLVFGRDWSQKSAGSRSDSAMELYLNKSYHPIATTIETDVKLALSTIKTEKLLESAAAVGGGVAGARERLAVFNADVLIAGNPALNFKAYLLTTLVPGVLALAAILTCVGSLTREWRQGRVNALLASEKNLRSTLFGRMVFWWVVYGLMGLAYLAWFAGWEGWGVQGSLTAWAVGMLLFLASMPAQAMLYTSLAPSWILAMSVAIGTTAPIFARTLFRPARQFGAPHTTCTVAVPSETVVLWRCVPSITSHVSTSPTTKASLRGAGPLVSIASTCRPLRVRRSASSVTGMSDTSTNSFNQLMGSLME